MLSASMAQTGQNMSQPSNPIRYTRKRIDMALAGYREHGSNVQAAKAAGVDESTLRLWRRKHPEFEAAVQVALDECAEQDGQLGVSVLRQHLQDALARTPVYEDAIVQRTGQIVSLRRPFVLNSTLVKTALTRYDTRFTHPKTEIEHSGSLTLEQSIAQAAAKLPDDAD